MKVEITNLAKKEFKLLEPLYLPIGSHDIYIPIGFATDLASIPAFLFWLQWGLWNAAAIAHDFAYANGFVIVCQPQVSSELIQIELTREQADFMFLNKLRQDGVNPLLARAMFLAVRAFGGPKWLGN